MLESTKCGVRGLAYVDEDIAIGKRQVHVGTDVAWANGSGASWKLVPKMLMWARCIGLSVFGTRNQAKDHGLRTVQRTAYPTVAFFTVYSLIPLPRVARRTRSSSSLC